MKMSFRIDRTLPKTVASRISDLLETRFGKHDSYVNHISTTLVDINGPRGGVSMRCRLVISTRGANPIVIEETTDDIGKAIGRAIDRADQAVSRERNRSAVKKNRRQRREELMPALI